MDTGTSKYSDDLSGKSLDILSIAERAARVGLWSLFLDSGEIYCSPGLHSLIGDYLGSMMPGMPPWQAALDPLDAAAALEMINQSIDQHTVFNQTYRLAQRGSNPRWIEVTGQATYDTAGRAILLSGSCTDVTGRQLHAQELREARERHDFLLKLTEALAPLSDPTLIQIEACRVLGQHLRVNRVFYAEMDETGTNRAGPQYVDGVNPTPEVWHSSEFDHTLQTRYASGEVLTCTDVRLNIELTQEQKAAYESEQIVAWAAAPIAKPDLPIGRLVIHQNKPRNWTRFEVELIKETAERVWPAVQRAKSQAALELAENIPVGTYTMIAEPGSTAARFSFLSKRFLEITSLDADEIRRDVLKAFACVHPDDYDTWLNKNADAFSNRSPFSGETRIIVKGATRWVRAESVPRMLRDGRTLWEGVLIDITEQRHAEEALKKSEERYRLTAEITQEAWWEEDVKAGVLTNSPRLCEMLNAEPALLQCSTSAYHNLIHPEDRERTRKAHSRTDEDDVPYQEVYRLRHADGHYIWVEDNARVIHRDAKGRATRMLGSMTDITQRKTAEEDLKESETALRQLFYDAPDAYTIWDVDSGRVVACNHAAARMLRGTREQIIGMDAARISPRHQPDGQQSTEVASRLFQKILDDGYHRFEWTLLRSDGDEFWAEITAAVGTFDKRKVLYVSWREIGEIITARREAESANATKSQFLSVVSHELRTPLNAIMGLFQLLQNAGSQERVRTLAAKGLNSSLHLLSIVNDILDLSAIEAGKISIASTPFDFDMLLEEAFFASSGRRKSTVAFDVDIDDRLRARILIGDALRLKQVLINLLDNAMKFTERGNVTLSVRCVGGTAQRPITEFSVTDSGIGMSQDQLSKLFKPFSQVDMSTTRRYSGTGLGLIISKRLVELMGGEPIAVKSEEGIGSQFTFRLPLGIVETKSLYSKAHVRHSDSRNPRRLIGHRILLADDDEGTRYMMRQLLEVEGAIVEEATEGVTATKMALDSNPPFDVVLMDILMPKRDGIASALELRAQGYAGPVIAFTANANAQDRETCLAAGMDDVVTKPVLMDQLVETLQRFRRQQ